MLEKLYELFMSFVTMILGFFGIELGKKSVSFAEGTKEEEKKEDATAEKASESTPAETTE
jgi:FMN-dependent NADH-azoreductase